MPELARAKDGHHVLLFMDAAHFIFSTFMVHLWCLTRKFMKSHAGRRRYNVLGALNSETKKVSVFTNDTVLDARCVCLFMKSLYSEYKGKAVSIILDNAKYQRCRLVQRYARVLGIELIYLPSYSPNLNLIERFWKYTKKEVLYAKFYKDYDSFKNKIDDCISNAHVQGKEKLASLLTTNFQSFNISQCLTRS